MFAHSEQKGIASVLADLARQDLFSRTDVSARVFVPANRCTDATVSNAQATLVVYVNAQLQKARGKGAAYW